MKRKLLFLVSMIILLGTSLASPTYAGFEGTIMETEPNNSFEEAMPINDTDLFGGFISSEDQDFYKVTVPKRGELFVNLGNLGEPSAYLQINSSVYNEAGELLSVGLAYGSNSNRLVVSPGTYYIHVSAKPSLVGEHEYFLQLAYNEGTITRLSGEDRYETSVKLAYRWALSTYEVILATGENFPDALAAGPLAKKMNAPILLTRKTQIPQSVKNFILDSKPKKVTIIGGTEVISQDVENYVKNVMGLQVERIAGSNRFDTAAQIADRLENQFGESVAYIVNGRNFPDALSISPIAAYEGAPILLTESDFIPPETLDISYNYDDFFIIGGENVVSDTIANELGSVIRISGNNRYETSAQVAEFFDYNFGDYQIGFVATGTNFADALAGAPLAATFQSPLLLTPSEYLHEDAKYFFEMYETPRFEILGGKNAVSENVENDLRSFIEQGEFSR
ncbi:cell wall-binding repeat-containing protein [Bacillus sp. 7884-1]|uniref:cell wall-binding repeat-containing protein n=1 Tax=Bacillus sp. 7884-1 TaxID=2021693 RepID=UPI000BA6CDE2|nr:cell wall-binding repeat-containing protein [Bacillus sp. 7884-1]PAE43446.1 hypothetical protein CHI06_06480 [Bacillus sp. 7884-1]